MATKCMNKQSNRDLLINVSAWVDKIYLVAYAVFICSEFLNLTGFYDYYHIFLWRWIMDTGLPLFFFLTAIFKIIKSYYENRKYAVFLSILLVGGLIYMFIKTDGILDVFVVLSLMISAYGIEFKKIADIFALSEGWACIATIVSSLIGIIPNIPVDEPDGRHYILLGFGSHNVLMIALFFICMSIVVSTAKKKFKFVEAGVIILLTIIGYKITASRTSSSVLMLGAVCLLLISIFNLKVFDRVRKIIFKVLKGILVTAPFLGLLISLAGTLAWNYIVRDMNFDYSVKDFALWGNTVTNRFADISINFAVHGFKLPWEPLKVAEVVSNEGTSFNYLLGGSFVTHNFDNLYASMFIVQGAIVFLLMMVWFVYRSIKAYKNDDITMLIVFGLISLFSVFEGVGKMPVYCPFILMPFSVWGLSRCADIDRMPGLEGNSEAEGMPGLEGRFEAEEMTGFEGSSEAEDELRTQGERECKTGSVSLITKCGLDIKRFLKIDKYLKFEIVLVIAFILFTIVDFWFVGRGFGIYPSYTISWLIVAWMVSVAAIMAVVYMIVTDQE